MTSVTAPRDPAAIAARSRELEGQPAEAILAWALEAYAPRIALSTEFGIEGCALLDMIARLAPGTPVFTVDTEFLFPETRALMDRLIDRYGTRLTVLTGAVSRAEQEATHGLALHDRDPDRCCALRKVEPTDRALVGLDAWVAGLRRDQGPTRAATPILDAIARPDGTTLIKVCPLVGWTRKDTWTYVTRNDVPYNALLDQGYASVGCWPCTRPTPPGGDERAGRWAGKAKTECGIHQGGPPPRPAQPCEPPHSLPVRP